MICWLCGSKNTRERPTCNSKSCQICVAVENVDKEIDQAVATLRRLLATRCALRSEQNRTHDLLQRLPAEVRDYVFELFLPLRNEWGEIACEEWRRGVMPSYLASICRGWRDISWSNPFLWSAMHIRLGGLSSTPDPSNFVQDWILRSRTLPLTFHIQVTYCSTKSGLKRSRDVLAQILGVMSQCSYRLQSLSLAIQAAILCNLQQTDFQWHRLTRFRTTLPYLITPPLALFNPTASPEKISLSAISLQSLQISWNRLSCATVRSVNFEDLTHLFQHASQMTDCHIIAFFRGSGDFSMPSITHHMLATLSLQFANSPDAAAMLLGSLTLPRLQEFRTDDEMLLLGHLPALARRSSCPLTRLTLYSFKIEGLPNPVPPLPGVTDLVVHDLQRDIHAVPIKGPLFEEYLPDLRHLTLRLQPFLFLWNMGFIPLYLDRKRPRSDGPNEGRLHKFLVVDQKRASNFDDIWNSVVGEELKALGIRLREDGFEFL